MHDLFSRRNVWQPVCALALGTSIAFSQITPSFAGSSTAFPQSSEASSVDLSSDAMETSPLISPTLLDKGAGVGVGKELFGDLEPVEDEVEMAGPISVLVAIGFKLAGNALATVPPLAEAEATQTGIIRQIISKCRNPAPGKKCRASIGRCDNGRFEIVMERKVHTGKYFQYWRVRPTKECREEDADCSFAAETGQCAPVVWLNRSDSWDIYFKK